MTSNPIQKKVRNSMLLGCLVTLLITGAIIAYLFMQLKNMKIEQDNIKASYISVYALNQDVKSGQIITEDMYQLVDVFLETVPSNATQTVDTFLNYSLVDEEGNRVYTDKEGTFLTKNSEYMEIFKEEETQKYYTYGVTGERKNVDNVNNSNLRTDEFGMYVIQPVEGKSRLYKEAATDKYYILRVKYNTNNSNQPVREKEYINIIGTPLVAKIDLNANTVLTTNMFGLGELVKSDVRKQEYNAIILPIDLISGEYIDIRFQLPSGQDFIVISKKLVEIPMIDGIDSVSTVRLELSEDEILAMSCAIVEAYRINGSKLYATKYVEPGMQEAAIPTYPINAETIALIQNNPNVTQTAMSNLVDRYNATLRNEHINKELQKETNTEDNIINKMDESITKTQEERSQYLESLGMGSVDEEME